MFQPYTKWEYLYPPRPEQAIPPALLDIYQSQGRIAEVKKNGTCTVLGVAPDKTLYLYTRHAELHKMWVPNPNSPCLRKLKELPAKWFVFVGEILHNKTTNIKDTFYIFDILVMNSEFLHNSTLISRLDRLHQLFKTTDGPYDYDLIDEKLWLTKPLINCNFGEIFRNLTAPEDEGLVLKDPLATLDFCTNASSNSKWQVKCRKRTKNYSH